MPKSCLSITFVEHQYFPKLSCIFVHSLYTTSGSVTNANGKIQFFCSFELFSFTKHCKMLVMFENRFRNMTKHMMKHFMFLIKFFVTLIDKNRLVFEQSNYRLNKTWGKSSLVTTSLGKYRHNKCNN